MGSMNSSSSIHRDNSNHPSNNNNNNNNSVRLMWFHFNPSVEKFQSCYNEIVRNGLEEKASLEYWVYGVKEAHPDYPNLPNMKIAKTEDVNLLMHKDNPSDRNLDELWSLYFGSGDNKYMKRVKDVADGLVPAGLIVTAAAKWSYNSIVEQEEKLFLEK